MRIKKNLIKFKKIKNELSNKKSIFKRAFRNNKVRIQNYLNPVQNLNVYFNKYNDGYLSLNVSNKDYQLKLSV